MYLSLCLSLFTAFWGISVFIFIRYFVVSMHWRFRKILICGMFYFAVTGCADILPVYGAMITRKGNHVTVRCNQSREEYHLKCFNMKWIGNVQNCSAGNIKIRIRNTAMQLLQTWTITVSGLIGNGQQYGDWYTGCWWVGCYSEEEPGRAAYLLTGEQTTARTDGRTDERTR